ALARVQEELRTSAGEQGIKWVVPEQFHYTLKFLGETPEEAVPRAAEAARAIIPQFAPFSLTLAGGGAVPQQRRAQVLWVGATEGVPLLARLAESLDRSLMERGFSPETRRFNPHLTLARMKTIEGQGMVAKTLTTEQKRVDKIGVVVVDSFV